MSQQTKRLQFDARDADISNIERIKKISGITKVTKIIRMALYLLAWYFTHKDQLRISKIKPDGSEVEVELLLEY